MSDSDHSTKTIAILVMIALLTVALLGAEAWNRSHRNRPNTPTPAAATQPTTPDPNLTATTGKEPKPAVTTGAPPPPPREVLLNE